MSSQPLHDETEPVAAEEEPVSTMPATVEAVNTIVASAWKHRLARWRRIGRIQLGRGLFRCTQLAKNPRQWKSSVSNVYRQVRQRPVTAATTTIAVIACALLVLPDDDAKQDDSNSEKETSVALDDVKIFPPGHGESPSKTRRPALPVQPRVAEKTEPPPFRNASSSNTRAHQKSSGPRLLGPQFPGNARAVVPAQPSDRTTPREPSQPARAVWFTGTVEDPEDDTGGRVSPVSYREPARRMTISNSPPWPPRRFPR